jgi:cytochrome P450
MATPMEVEELDVLRDLRARSYAGSGVFWIRDGELGVFEPEAAQRLNAANFRDLTLPDRLLDLLLRRRSIPVSWKKVRAAWIAQLRNVADGEGIARLATRMADLLDQRLNRKLDLVWAAQEVSTRSLVPIVVDGLTPADTARLARDQTFKLRRLMAIEPARGSLLKTARETCIQVSSGLVVRRELRGRRAGRRPRRLDLTDPIVDLLPALGMDRAVDSVTAVLTAIAGPPGASAACMLYELTRRPDWSARLTAELGAVAPAELYAAPTCVAPVTHRFVKETLRMWSPPLLLNRSARTDIELGEARLAAGERYFLSSYLIHHDSRHWPDPDTFDPDRWLPGSERIGCPASSYVPFGWSPRTCIGATLGTAQLIVLCHLLCTRYRVEVAEPEAVGMALGAVPLPLRFQGTISRLPAPPPGNGQLRPALAVEPAALACQG